MTNPIKTWRDHKKISGILGRKGKIISWTVISGTPIVLVKLEDGKNILVQMVDFNKNQLKTGQKIITVLRKTKESPANEVISYGIKVKPV